MWAPICQVGTWQGMFGEVEITHDKLDEWISAFGRDEKIPATRGHMADPENPHASTDVPALCWVSGLMKAGDLLLGNFVDWTPEGFDAVSSGGYKNVSIESKNGSRLDSVAFLGARTPGVDFHSENGRFAPLDMAGECMGDVGKVVLAQSLAALGEPIALPYKNPPKKITDLFDDDAGPGAWTKAFNAAYEEYDGDEAKANATAWATIKKMGYVKGQDGKYRKSKKAAGAAEEGGQTMAEHDAAKAAEKENVVLAWLKEKFGGGEKSEAEPIVAAKSDAKESAEVLALRKEVDELKSTVMSQRTEFEAASLMVESEKLCLAASAEPRFVPVVAQLLAAIPPDREVTLDEAGEHKTTARQAFKNLLLAKGTAKLDDPKKLADAPAKVEVEILKPEEETGTTSEARQAEIVKEAKAEALTAGKGDDKVFIASLIKDKMGVK